MALIQPTASYGNSAVGQVTYTWTLTTSDTGAPQDVSELFGKMVQVTSGGAGTAQIRATIDGTNFVGLTAALAIGTAAPMPVGLASLALDVDAVDISAVASATVTVTLSGFRPS